MRQLLSHDLLVNAKFLSQDGLRLPENPVSFGPVMTFHPEESHLIDLALSLCLCTLKGSEIRITARPGAARWRDANHSYVSWHLHALAYFVFVSFACITKSELAKKPSTRQGRNEWVSSLQTCRLWPACENQSFSHSQVARRLICIDLAVRIEPQKANMQSANLVNQRMCPKTRNYQNKIYKKYQHILW